MLIYFIYILVIIILLIVIVIAFQAVNRGIKAKRKIDKSINNKNIIKEIKNSDE